MIRIIAAIGDKNNVLGKNNTLLWHLPKDFKRFQELTSGNPIIMGRKTFESLPGLLKNRTHIVITRNKNWIHEGVIVVSSVEEAIREAVKISSEVYVIGGGEIYALAMPLADELLITRVHGDFEGDAFFPEIKPEWKLREVIENKRDEKHKFDYDYERYVSEPTSL